MHSVDVFRCAQNTTDAGVSTARDREIKQIESIRFTEMPKRKRQSKKKLLGKGRLNDAKRWLSNHPQKNLIPAYAKRYGVDHDVAEDELIQLGYYDEILIQTYEKEGIEWEYMVEPTTGEMVVVPKGTEEHEIYEIHGMF